MNPIEKTKKHISKVSSILGVNGLYPGVARLCVWLGLTHVFIGISALIDPGLYSSEGLEDASSLLPLTIWGIIALIEGAVLMWAGIKSRTELARVGLVVYIVVQILFATSFIVFAFSNSEELINSLMWLTGPIVAMIMLVQPARGSSA